MPPRWDRDRNEYNAEVLEAYNDVMQAWRDAWQGEDTKAMAALYSDRAHLIRGIRDGDNTRTLIGTYAIILIREGRTWKIRTQVFTSAPPRE